MTKQIGRDTLRRLEVASIFGELAEGQTLERDIRLYTKVLTKKERERDRTRGNLDHLKVKRARDKRFRDRRRKRRLHRDVQRRFMSKPGMKERHRLQMKRKRVLDRIEQWTVDAKIRCVGRDFPPEEWLTIMVHPRTYEEMKAQTDFIYFLRHRQVPRSKIAGMLGVTIEYVNNALNSRGVVT